MHRVNARVVESFGVRVVQRVGPKRKRQLVGPHRAHAGEATPGVRHEHLHERHRVGVRAEMQVGEQAGGELALFEAEEPAQSRVAVGHDPEMEAAARNDEPPTLGFHEPGPAVGEFVGGGVLPAPQERSSRPCVVRGMKDQKCIAVDGATELVRETAEVRTEPRPGGPIRTRRPQVLRVSNEVTVGPMLQEAVVVGPSGDPVDPAPTGPLPGLKGGTEQRVQEAGQGSHA